MFNLTIHLLQALAGGLIIMWLRNDRNESEFGIRLTRSVWTAAAVLFASALIAADMFQRHSFWVALLSTFMASGFVAYIITAPHGQVLDGPHQDIPPEEDDPSFEAAMWITNHQGGAGDRLGWPTWIAYNMFRYVLPCAMLGVVVGSPLTTASGVLIVLSYWPLAYLPPIKRRWDTRFSGAFMCGAWLFLGL